MFFHLPLRFSQCEQLVMVEGVNIPYLHYPLVPDTDIGHSSSFLQLLLPILYLSPLTRFRYPPPPPEGKIKTESSNLLPSDSPSMFFLRPAVLQTPPPFFFGSPTYLACSGISGAGIFCAPKRAGDWQRNKQTAFSALALNRH